jgi:hypothetical protein
MELEGFSSSLQGKSIVIVIEKEEDAWIPWECLTESTTILVCGKEPRKHRILRDSAPWSLIWSPSTSREWSMLATVIKAIGSVILVLDLNAPLPPFAFIEFLESLPSVTKVQIVQKGIGVFGTPHTVIWSEGVLIGSRMEVLQTLRYREGEAAVTAASAAAKESNVQLMASQEEGAWKLYWIRPADSWMLIKQVEEFARCSLRTGMKLLDLS